MTIFCAYKKLQKHYIFIILLTIILGISFCNFDKFMDAELKSKWYYLYLMMPISLLLMIRGMDKTVRHIRIFKPLLMLLLLYFFIRIAFGQFILSYIVFCFLLILLYFLLARITFLQSFAYISISVIIVSLLMSLYGISQYVGLLPSGYLFKIVGNFDNPAGYASMLSISIPFVCYYVFLYKRNASTLLLWIIYILIMLAIILSASRTGILASVTVTIIYAVKRYKQHIPNIPLCIKCFFILGIVVAIFTFYVLKKDSVRGRIIIWRCTWEMVKEEPLFGHGYKSFKAKYMLYQAKYFEQNQESGYVLLSDNVKHPFNEFLLLIVEFGLFALFLVFLFVMQLIFMYRKRQTDELFTLAMSLLAVAIFSSFSYPFQYPYTWFISFFCVMSIFFVSKKSQYKIRWLSKSLILMASISLLYITLKEMYYENKWYTVVKKNELGNMQEIMATYSTLYPHLKQNAYFLYNYAAKLNYWGYYKESSSLVEECEDCLNDYDVQMLKADDYFRVKKWDRAKKCYNMAYFMCPNRYMPLNQLHKIAVLENDSNEARKMACLIINKPIKIPSATINKMKQKMREYLENEINNAEQ